MLFYLLVFFIFIACHYCQAKYTISFREKRYFHTTGVVCLRMQVIDTDRNEQVEIVGLDEDGDADGILTYIQSGKTYEARFNSQVCISNTGYICGYTDGPERNSPIRPLYFHGTLIVRRKKSRGIVEIDRVIAWEDLGRWTSLYPMKPRFPTRKVCTDILRGRCKSCHLSCRDLFMDASTAHCDGQRIF